MGEEAAPADLLRQNRMLERRLRRMEADIAQVEEFQDSNATLLSRLLRDLEAERAKSQRLLLNVLPQRIIDRLAAGEGLIADRHDEVTVLFSDIVGFTTISSELAPSALVEELNALFSGFDAICDETGVDKIKTVGDAYLAVGGLDGDGPAGERAIAEAALRMQAFARERAAAGGWQVRIGLHAGPIIAGVVGTSKFAYDVWGDTVNTASRLETTSEAGRIHVSADLARRLEATFVVEPRGMVDLKGKGATETYWLVGRRAGAG
jgi:class 3 adenylate cyclase